MPLIKNKKLTTSECASVFTALLLALIALLYFLDGFAAFSVFVRGNFFLYDFQLRYNEVRCLLSGIDPFDVWSGEVSSPSYAPFFWGCTNYRWHQYVCAYPPWSYSFFLPFALLPKQVAAVCWLIVELLSALLLYGFTFFDNRKSTPLWMRLFPVIATLPILPCVWDCLRPSNYGIVIAASVLSMAVCLNRNRQWWAGLFLSITMIKPQIGLIFVVPLLIGRQYKAILSGGIICLLATIPPALMCGGSPFDMILAIRDYSSAYNVGSLPEGSFILWTFSLLSELSSKSGNMALNAFVGITSCVVLSVLFKNERNWLVRFIPTLALCVMWTVSREYDCCVYIILFFVLARMAVNDFKHLDVVSASFIPYCCAIICREIDLRLFVSSSVVICIGLVAFSVGLYVARNRRLARNVLIATVPMSVWAVTVNCVNMRIWSLVYLLVVACMSKSGNTRELMLLMVSSFLYSLSGLVLPSQTTGWVIVVLLFGLGKKLHSHPSAQKLPLTGLQSGCELSKDVVRDSAY